jgi:hypothetical protein
MGGFFLSNVAFSNFLFNQKFQNLLIFVKCYISRIHVLTKNSRIS